MARRRRLVGFLRFWRELPRFGFCDRRQRRRVDTEATRDLERLKQSMLHSFGVFGEMGIEGEEWPVAGPVGKKTGTMETCGN